MLVVRVLPIQATKDLRVGRGMPLPFLRPRHWRWGWGVSTTPRPLYPRERPGTHCTRGWVGSRAGLDGCGKSRPPPGFDPRTVQPVASRYTDCAIPAASACCKGLKNSVTSDLREIRVYKQLEASLVEAETFSPVVIHWELRGLYLKERLRSNTEFVLASHNVVFWCSGVLVFWCSGAWHCVLCLTVTFIFRQKLGGGAVFSTET